MGTFVFILLASLFISLISFAGAILLVRSSILKSNITNYLVSFAAGTMLATAFLDLLPESLKSIGNGSVFYPMFGGIVLFFFLERFVLWYHHHDSSHNIKPAAYLVLFGDGLHNILDGVAIAAAFLVNTEVGLVTTIAISAHEIPQEIADFSVLVDGGMEKRKALIFNFLSGLPAVAGAILSYFFLTRVQAFVPPFLSFTSGMFVYIACSDLIPEIHKDFSQRRNWTQSLPFVGGIVLIGVLMRMLE